MNELAIFEKLLGGTISASAVLGFVAWQLWRRLTMREEQTNTLMREVLLGLACSTNAMKSAADAVGALREAIERSERRPVSRHEVDAV